LIEKVFLALVAWLLLDVLIALGWSRVKNKSEAHHRGGEVLADDSAASAFMFEPNLDLSDFVTVGFHPFWDHALVSPASNVAWVVAFRGDAVSTDMGAHPDRSAVSGTERREGDPVRGSPFDSTGRHVSEHLPRRPTRLCHRRVPLTTNLAGAVSPLEAGWSHEARTAAVELANASAFGALWVAQYVILDRLVFRQEKPDIDSRDRSDRPGHWAMAARLDGALECESFDLETVEATPG
jgi:hypothetical protein